MQLFTVFTILQKTKRLFLFAFCCIILSMINLKETEKLEDLQVGGLKIIQDANEYRFTSDAVLLANSVNAKSGDVVVDFGTGSGIISILIAYKKKPQKVIAVEIQPQLADMAKRSVEYNGLDDRIEVVNASLQEFAKNYGGKKVDVAVCNPPYIKGGGGETQLQESLKICRHEVKVTLEEICFSASKILKNGGKFYIVHKAERTAEIFRLMTKYDVQPKEITTVCAREGDAPYLVIVCGTKQGKEGLRWNKPIVMYDDDGNFTQTIKKLYGETDG